MTVDNLVTNAVIEYLEDKVVIEIPSFKKKRIIAFFSFWVFGWLVGIMRALRMLIVGNNILFAFIWLGLWVYVGLKAVKMLLWRVNGREVITIEESGLIIETRAFMLNTSKRYDFDQIENLSVVEAAIESGDGKIQFDYKGEHIEFAYNVSLEEANYLVNHFMSK